MQMLTRFFLLLTVLALLPLGSFAPKFLTSPPPAAAISAQLDDHVKVLPQAEKTFVSALKRCKGPVLPGSPCNPALAVWHSKVTLSFQTPATAVYPSDWLPMIGRNPPRAIGPPRLG